MSTEAVVVILIVSVAGALVCAVQARRALRQPLDRDRIVADAILRTSPPELLTEPGTDAALLDDCELLWSMPAYVAPDIAAGRDRLRSAVRDEQPEGESS